MNDEWQASQRFQHMEVPRTQGIDMRSSRYTYDLPNKKKCALRKDLRKILSGAKVWHRVTQCGLLWVYYLNLGILPNSGLQNTTGTSDFFSVLLKCGGKSHAPICFHQSILVN